MEEAEYYRMFEAEDSHWWYVALHDLVMRSLPPGPAALRIFDAGCGTGRLLQLLSARGTASGCDLSPTALALCRKRGVNAVSRGDLNTMQFPAGCYDIVTSLDVLYHRAVRDDRAVVQQFHRMLAPGGRLILQVPAFEWLRSSHDRAVHTGRRYRKADVVRMLEECGFIVMKATYRVCPLFVFIACRRLLQKMAARLTGREGAPRSDVSLPPSPVNRLLAALLRLENRLLGIIPMPFGSSVFVIARKQDRVRG